jgi:hypothetical protein
MNNDDEEKLAERFLAKAELAKIEAHLERERAIWHDLHNGLNTLIAKERELSALMESILIKLSDIKRHSGFSADEIYLLADESRETLIKIQNLRSE